MNKYTRRQILGAGLATVASIPLAAISSRAVAADGAKVDPNDPQAKALAYVHASPDAERNCANCQLYTDASAAEWGPCAIFPGKQVAAAGWCTAWVKRAG